MLKIQEIFDSKRGKKKVKLVSFSGKDASPARGIDTEVLGISFFGGWGSPPWHSLYQGVG